MDSVTRFQILHRAICCILTLDRAVNQRCTWVNKRKKKQKKVGVMKEYWQVSATVELVGDRKARVRASLQTEGWTPQRPPVEQTQPRCGRSAAMVNRKIWVNIAVCPCLHSSLTNNRNINPFENKMWYIYIYIYIYFYKEVCSFVHWSLSFMFDYVSAYICITAIQHICI